MMLKYREERERSEDMFPCITDIYNLFEARKRIQVEEAPNTGGFANTLWTTDASFAVKLKPPKRRILK